MNGNITLGARIDRLEKGGGSTIKKEIEKLNNEVETIKTEISKGHVYSEEEKVSGTWLDGKPIYQKTLHGTSTQGNNYTIDLTQLNIDKLVGSNLNRLKNVNNDTVITDCYYNTNVDYFYYFYTENDKIMHLVSGNVYSFGEYYITIFYTKTTDTTT